MRFAGQALGGGFGDLMGQGETTDFGMMSRNNMKARGQEKIAGHEAETQISSYGLKSIADIKSAEALAAVAQGQAAGQAAMVSGISSGIGSLIGGIDFGGSLFGGAPQAVDRRSPGMGIPGSVGSNGKPMYGPGW